MMPKFIFFDKPYFGQVAGWLSVPYETSCLLREAGVAGRSPLVDVMEAVDIPLSETAFDVSGLAILFGTQFKTLQDAIPEPYFSYLKGKKTKELPDDFIW
ncbi:MAG: hypothetical protein LUC43_01475 [Burkholderiales bacterium]|nr:hypothetical protein [Burkholderiales bacterium]